MKSVNQFSKNSMNILYSTKGFKSIAVIGGGIAGLGCALSLSSYKNNRITIYDENSAGTGGASSASAGMIHPLTPQCKLIWEGVKGFYASKSIIDSLDTNVIQKNRNILRPALTEDHKKIYFKAAEQLPEVYSKQIYSL